MALPQEKLSLEAFLDWEAKQPERHFFWRGEVFAMVGVRQAHATVTLNIGAALKSALRGTPCRAFVADMKLRVDLADAVFYPDVMVTCDARDRTTPLWLAHPKLIVEVLSDTTAAFDRGAKFAAYRMIDTLEEYVLIDIDTRGSEVFRRNAAGRWELFEYARAAALELTSLGLMLDAQTLYEGLDSEAAA